MYKGWKDGMTGRRDRAGNGGTPEGAVRPRSAVGRAPVTGKLAALTGAVTTFPESLPDSGASARPHEGPALETPAFVELRSRVARALDEQATDIARRWERQARSVALRDDDFPAGELGGDGSVRSAVALIHALGAALASDGSSTDDGVALGLAFGVDAFEAGASLHHTLKALDLLSAMTMYAVENVVVGEADGTGSVGDGVRLCRRMQQASSLIALAATKGYTQAVSDGLRDRFRLLRHDLRNPLGTIKSVLALMDDESVPADARAHPRFRAMAERNARSLDELIVDRLSDAAALLPALSHQRVSLRVIACSVRRDLRGEAEARETTVLVGDARVRVCVDAVSLELLLHTLLLAALQETGEGDELIIDFGEPTADRATLLLSRAPARAPVTDPASAERLVSLAARMGAKVTLGEVIVLSVPIRREAAEGAARETPPAPAATASRESAAR
jgi:signal transduction histidine kinase